MKKILIISALLLILFSNINYVKAEELGASNNNCPPDRVCLNNPLGITDPNVLIGKVIRATLGLVGSLALVMFIYGGFVWMTGGGNSEKVTKGKNIIIWATIGLIVIFSAYALVKFVLTGLGVE
jgi:hypothetical protein